MGLELQASATSPPRCCGFRLFRPGQGRPAAGVRQRERQPGLGPERARAGGALAANATTAGTPETGLVIAAGNTLEALVGASVGVTTLCVAGLADWSNYLPVWTTWWLGDAAGALVVTPVLVLRGRSLDRAIEGARAGRLERAV